MKFLQSYSSCLESIKKLQKSCAIRSLKLNFFAIRRAYTATDAYSLDTGPPWKDEEEPPSLLLPVATRPQRYVPLHQFSIRSLLRRVIRGVGCIIPNLDLLHSRVQHPSDSQNHEHPDPSIGS